MASQQGKLEVRKADVITGLDSNERSINRVVRDLSEAELIATERGTITIRSVAGDEPLRIAKCGLAEN